MASRRSLPLLIALLVATSVLAGGAFSAVSTERGVQVAIVDDEDAYLGLERLTPLELPPDETDDKEVIRLTNQFPTTLAAISVSVAEGKSALPTIIDAKAPSSLGPGGAGWITADIDCGTSGNEETVTFTIAASGRNTVELAREITIDCEQSTENEPEVTEFEFKGCSEAWVVLATEPSASFEASFQIYDSAAETTRTIDVPVRPEELETVPDFDDSAMIYEFNVHEQLGHPESGDDKVLAVSIEGVASSENTHRCASVESAG